MKKGKSISVDIPTVIDKKKLSAIEEIKEYLDGCLKDMKFQIKDIRDNTSPFNIEQLKSQIQTLDARTLTLNDRIIRIEDLIKNGLLNENKNT